mmetsp:Transcript_38787/g.63854  ORF Transcript_38787/g.63854 Transcript_38787/m.63854 type:complete len:173 (+) Transcript_38787:103-621(+)
MLCHTATTLKAGARRSLATQQSRGLSRVVKATLFHNPNCSKSRAALELLQTEGKAIAEKNDAILSVVVREYMTDVPCIDTLANIQRCLGKAPKNWIRKSSPENVYEESGVEGVLHDDEKVLQKMSEYPALIERPILLLEGDSIFHTAVIGRPPSAILDELRETFETTHCGQF